MLFFALSQKVAGIYTPFFDFFGVIYLFLSYHLSQNNLLDSLNFSMQIFIKYFHIFHLAHSSTLNVTGHDVTHPDRKSVV